MAAAEAGSGGGGASGAHSDSKHRDEDVMGEGTCHALGNYPHTPRLHTRTSPPPQSWHPFVCICGSRHAACWWRVGALASFTAVPHGRISAGHVCVEYDAPTDVPLPHPGSADEDGSGDFDDSDDDEDDSRGAMA